MTLAERVAARRQCPETYQGQQCPLPEKHTEPCQFGDVRMRIPMWLRKAHEQPNGLARLLDSGTRA